MAKRSLLIGCGHSRVKQLYVEGQTEWAGELTTMDVSPICGADVVFDMEALFRQQPPEHSMLKSRGMGVLPFDDDTFDEIGAFNSAEHWGRQGDFRGWFHECSEYWRILKPGGLMHFLVPIGADALADPGHTRFFQRNWFYFLNQSFYDQNEVKQTCYSDYRWLWKLNFDILHCQEHDGHHLAVVLRKA